MLNIYLTRHGQDESNSNGFLNGRIDTPLTNLGIRQAQNLASKIKKLNIKFDVVYCSPLARSLKTAQIITGICGLKRPKQNQLLIERDFGFMSGKKVDDISRLCSPHILKTKTCTYFLNAPGSESFPELILRARKFLDYIEKKHISGDILLVTHGDIGKMLFASYYHVYWKKALELFHFGNTELILLSNKLSGVWSKIIKARQYNL